MSQATPVPTTLGARILAFPAPPRAAIANDNDAHFMRLVDQLKAVQKAIKEAGDHAMQRHFAHENRLIAAIGATPVRTIAGLQVKAALFRSESVDQGAALDSGSLDAVLAVSLCEDIARLTA